MVHATEKLRNHQLVILRRLRNGPLTEFELAREVAENSAYSVEECAERMADWLGELRGAGLLWSGTLTNVDGQHLLAAALTKRGVELVSA